MRVEPLLPIIEKLNFRFVALAVILFVSFDIVRSIIKKIINCSSERVLINSLHNKEIKMILYKNLISVLILLLA